jgi:hypothetical protein
MPVRNIGCCFILGTNEPSLTYLIGKSSKSFMEGFSMKSNDYATRRDEMKIEVELSSAEVTYLSTCCIQRVMTSAINAVPDDYEYLQDLFDLSEVMEPLRMKLANAIFLAKIKEIG